MTDQATSNSQPNPTFSLSSDTCPSILHTLISKSCQTRLSSTDEHMVLYGWQRDVGFLLLRMLLQVFLWIKFPTKSSAWHQDSINSLSSSGVLRAIIRSAFPGDNGAGFIWGDLLHAFCPFYLHIIDLEESPFAHTEHMFARLVPLLGGQPTSKDGTNQEGNGGPSSFLSVLRERAGSIKDRPVGSTVVDLPPSTLVPRKAITSIYNTVSFQRTWLTKNEYTHLLELGSKGHKLLARMAALELMGEGSPDQLFLQICTKTFETGNSSVTLLRAIGFSPAVTPVDPSQSMDDLRVILGIMYAIHGNLNDWLPLFRESGTMIKDVYELSMNSIARSENAMPAASEPAPSTTKAATESNPTRASTTKPPTNTETAFESKPSTSTATSKPKQEPHKHITNAGLSKNSGPSSSSARSTQTAPVSETPVRQGKGKEKAQAIPALGPSYRSDSDEVKKVISDAVASVQECGPSARSTKAPATKPTSSRFIRPSPELWASLTCSPNDSSVLNLLKSNPSKASLASVDRCSAQSSPSINPQATSGRKFQQNSPQISSSSVIQGARQAVANVFLAPVRKRKATSSPQIQSEPQMSTTLPSAPQNSYRQGSESERPPPFASRFVNSVKRFNRNGQLSNNHNHKQPFNNRKL